MVFLHVFEESGRITAEETSAVLQRATLKISLVYRCK
jgi:hypothetical protein